MERKNWVQELDKSTDWSITLDSDEMITTNGTWLHWLMWRLNLNWLTWQLTKEFEKEVESWGIQMGKP